MRVGCDKIVDCINDSYDEALERLRLIPIWIGFSIEYEKYVTKVQDKLYQEQADTMFKITGSSIVEGEVNTPITMDKIKIMLKTYSVDQVKNVLTYYSNNPEKLQTGDFKYLKTWN